MKSLIGKIFILISWTILYADKISSPPNIPELQAVGGHEEVFLMWDKIIESIQFLGNAFF